MNKNNKYIRKIRHDAKALSPVVASIILIAVTVAVSIAVAAWMGGMTIGFMGSSSVTITNVDFQNTPSNQIELTLKNTGTKTVTIAAVRINNNLLSATVPEFAPDSATYSTNATLSVNAGDTLFLVLTGNYAAWVAGNPYKIDLYDGSNQVVGSAQQNSPGA
jgi:archaeal type IV pilus assembly protein PilA